MGKFFDDLGNAKIYEQQIEQRLQDLGHATTNTTHLKRFADYDISVTSATTNRVYKIECKFQTHPENVYIEAGQYLTDSFKQSGILITSATSTHHAFIFSNDTNIYLIRTPLLTQLIASEEYSNKRIDNAGYLLYVFPRQTIIEHCNIL